MENGVVGSRGAFERTAARRRLIVAAVAGILGFAAGRAIAAPPPSPAATVIPVTVDGATQNVLFIPPAGPPVAAVVMLPGGDGRIGVQPNGTFQRGGNFLIRTRDLWLARRFFFVAVDAAEARAGSHGDRIGPANLRAMAEIVRLVRQRTTAPIWLVGTSAGGPAALAGAASMPPGTVRGAVISSPVSMPGIHDTVFEVPLAQIRTPVLIQINREDGCAFTPPANAPRIKAALKASPAVDIQEFAGGDWPRSGPCEAFARHGFLGIEAQVVNAAADWMQAH